MAPPVAWARTLDDIASELAQVEADIAEDEQAVATAQDFVATSMRNSYKDGSTGLASVWSVILDSDSMESLVTAMQYASSVARRYGQAVSEAKQALHSLDEERERLEACRDEEALRIAILENRDGEGQHFCQWGESWSSLPYFAGGTVGNDGCGLCAYTTMVNLLTGSTYTPDSMLSLRGDWVGQEEQVDSAVGTPDGTTHGEWTKSHFDIDLVQIDVSVGSCRKALSQGETVLIVGPEGTRMHDRYGTWRYTNGHYVCVYRCDDDGFYLHDSAYSGDAGTAVFYTNEEFSDLLLATPVVLQCSN